MVGIKFKINAAKSLFFDRQRVKNALDAGSRSVLSKIGAFIRQRAKTSIKKRKGISNPGAPPHSHTHLLRQFIFFVYDPGRRSVLIGPAKLNKPGRALELLEFGGTASRPKERRTYFRRSQPGTKKLSRVMVYRPRPFMGPAYEAEKGKLPELWRNAFTRR